MRTLSTAGGKTQANLGAPSSLRTPAAEGLKLTRRLTARQAAEIASAAEVRLLALTHLSTRYFPRDVRDEARAVFRDTIVPRDFDAIEVPFPERGAPHVLREDTPAPT